MKKAITLLLVIVVAALSLLPTSAQDARTPDEICEEATPAPEPDTRDFSEPEQVLEPGVDYRAVFCTDAGAVYIDLLEEYAPITVNSFVFLAESGYYNNLIFHRVIEDFMAQGGDPTGTGTGGPGYQFTDEFVGFLHFDRPGWLAMANAGPGTNGSQFFITTVPTEHLNYRHTIFGEVLEGQENVENIQVRDPASGGAATNLQTVVIITDPSTVVTDYVAPEPATQDDVVAAFEAIGEQFPAESGLVGGVEVSTTANVADAADSSDDVAEFLETNNHEYRVSGSLVNGNCDMTNVAFTSIRYTLDAFASADDAANALGDPFMAEWLVSEGFNEPTESENAGLLLYTREVNECNQTAITGLAQWQRGRFIATVQVTLPASSEDLPFLDLWIDQVVGRQVYENQLSDVLRPEITR